MGDIGLSSSSEGGIEQRWRRRSHRKPVSRVLPSLDMGRKDRGTHSRILCYKDTLVLHTVQSHWDVYVTPGLALAHC